MVNPFRKSCLNSRLYSDYRHCSGSTSCIRSDLFCDGNIHCPEMPKYEGADNCEEPVVTDQTYYNVPPSHDCNSCLSRCQSSCCILHQGYLCGLPTFSRNADQSKSAFKQCRKPRRWQDSWDPSNTRPSKSRTTQQCTIPGRPASIVNSAKIRIKSSQWKWKHKRSKYTTLAI